jgi:hypothetical protein
MTPDAFDKLHSSVQRIEKAIVGDEAMGHKGIVERLEDMEHRLNAHEKKLLKWGGGFVGAGVVVSYAPKLLSMLGG